MSDKTDFKSNVITKDIECHYILLKGVVQQENITLVNIYVPNMRAHKYMRKIWEDFKREIDDNTVSEGNFNTPLSTMDRSSR